MLVEERMRRYDRVLDNDEESERGRSKILHTRIVSKVEERGRRRKMGEVPITEIEDLELETPPPHSMNYKERAQPASPEQLEKDHRLSFFDDYEYANGVPTFVMRPVPQSRFTCYTLSEDGKLFATGDSAGGIKIWNAVNYSPIVESVVRFCSNVHCLSFMDGCSELLAAVGDGGSLKEFKIEHEGAIAANGRQIFATIMPRGNDRILAVLSNGSTITAWQFSGDGRTLACSAQQRGKIEFWVYRVQEALPILAARLSCEGQKLTSPVLSPNGESVLSFIRKEKEQTSSTDATESHTQDVEVQIVVWKKLCFAENTADTPRYRHQRGAVERPADPQWSRRPIFIDGVLGTWGREGNYLLLWKKSTDDHGPTLEIYRTSDLKPQGSRVFARRTLDRGLLAWDAQILDQCSTCEGLIVAIYETFDLSRRRLLLWNAEQDVVCTEVYVPVPAECPDEIFTVSEVRQWAIDEEKLDSLLDSLLESGMVDDKMSEECYLNKVADIVYPKFAVSSDLTIAAFFSWRFEAIVMVSLTSGATLWQCRLPPSMRSNPFGAINTCRFDKSECRVMVMGEEAILAFAPSCLATDLVHCARYQCLREEDNSEFIPVRGWFTHYRHLPKAAFSEWISHLLWKALQSDVLLENIPPEIPPDLLQRPEIIDAAVSVDGRRIAFVIKRNEIHNVFVTENLSNTNIWELEKDTNVLKRLRIISPMETDPYSDTASEDFRATQVYLCKSIEENDMLFIEGRLSGRFSVCCYDLVKQTREAVLRTHNESGNIFNTPCLSSVQTVEGHRILLLDLQQIYIFDPKALNWVVIKYKSNFMTTLRNLNSEVWWSVLKRHRKISDDGKRVLIGWNEITQKHLVITPEITDLDVASRIEEVGGNISFDCAISHDGEWIAYASIHKESNCKSSIGVYKIAEETTMHMLSIDMGPERDELMASLFFSFSPNGNSIILANGAWEEDQGSPICLLTPYDAERCLPDERKLKLTVDGNTEETTRCIHEFYEHYGVGICNMPNVAGVSMLDTAFLNEDNLAIQKIQEISKDHGFCLPMPCMLSPIGCGTSIHPLQYIFKKKFLDGGDGMKGLMSLLCQHHFHINHKAAILKTIFVDVWMRQSETIKDVLSKNKLIVDICTLHVHDDFFSREDHIGIHLETADSLMEWSCLEKRHRDLVWRDRHRNTIRKKEDCENASIVSATLKVVCLEDIAQIGKEGILRRLLLQDVPDYFYKYDAVKWTIHLKWKVFWKRRCWKNAFWYAAFVPIFTIYASLVGSGGTFQDKDTLIFALEIIFLSLSWMFALWMMYEECLQIASLMKDGEEFVKRKYRGFLTYIASKWNLIQFTSCTMLLAFIPVFHILACCDPTFESTLAVFIGFESIFVWFKVWYHAQAFKATGPLVLMISNIVAESFYFLFLALMILIGFSLGLHVMFNHLPENSNVPEYREQANEFFGTLPNSMLTLFYALFANFPSELFLLTNNVSMLITLTFVSYIFLETVVLLNLLIAIMGDTFDKVRSREESQLLKGRAKYIDAGEAALNHRQRIAYQKLIKKYLLVLVRDADESAKINSDEEGEWSGRITAIREMMETAFRNQDRRQRSELGELKKTIRRSLGTLGERTEQEENA